MKVKKHCDVEGCTRSYYSMGKCRRHRADLAGHKTCSIDGCSNVYYGNGLCQPHYQKGKRGLLNQRAQERMQDLEFAKKRREQKKLAQRNYIKKNKNYISLKNRAKKEHKVVQFTLEEYLLIKKDNCEKCDKVLKGSGPGLGLKDPFKDYSEDNVFTVCSTCIRKKDKAFNRLSFCKQLLRRYSRRSPAFTMCLTAARISRGLYECNHCKLPTKKKEVQVDHIDPVIPVDREVTSLDEYAERLYCSVDNLQVLCTSCHQKKTDIENEQRRIHKKIPEEKKSLDNAK